MVMQESVSRPCYSVRLVRPFAKLLRTYASIPGEVLDPLDALDNDDRIPIETLHELLRGGLVLTGDEDLGLKAARELELGGFGALEYAASSARTSRDAIEVIGRYMHLLNDALTVSIEAGDPIARIVLHNSVALPRAAEDFEVGALHVAIRKREIGREQRYDVHFQHAQPADTREYAATFGSARVCFGAAFTGFTLDRSELDQELPTQDPHLHKLISRHADQLLAELPKVQTFTERVRAQLVLELRGGDPTAPRVGKALGVSTRTLTRKLAGEGTNFQALLDALRRALSLRYIESTDLALAELALLLGFSNTPAFNRAFKRWTGKTPAEHRRTRRG